MRWGLFTVIIAPVLVLGIFVGYNLTAPADFPHGAIVRIEEGVGLYTLAERLKDEGVIRSPFFFRAVAILMGGERQMKAGHYYVPEREGTLHLAYRILHGRYGLKRYKLTIPEGFTVKKISGAFDEKFPFFDNTYFEREAREGYLFPDTYFVYETATASSTLALFADNFRKKVDPLQSEIVVAGKTLAEIMTMASIIEGEAKTPEDKTIVSGILWKRIKLGLPLQVDASFVYFLGKSTREITQDD